MWVVALLYGIKGSADDSTSDCVYFSFLFGISSINVDIVEFPG